MAVVPAAVKRPRMELVAAAQSQQLVAMVRRVTTTKVLIYIYQRQTTLKHIINYYIYELHVVLSALRIAFRCINGTMWLAKPLRRKIKITSL